MSTKADRRARLRIAIDRHGPFSDDAYVAAAQGRSSRELRELEAMLKAAQLTKEPVEVWS